MNNPSKRRWYQFSMRTLLIGAAIVLSGSTPSFRKPPIPQLPFDVIRQWHRAGAESGWVRVRTDGLIDFSGEPETADDVPAFRFYHWKSGTLRTLPRPPCPFGLVLSFTEINDTEIKELNQFNTLAMLDLGETNIAGNGLGALVGL
jgi:hypothetical protein